jgi:L-ascorbate metabolism protein UlaG (beta-lactamase superfamily)
MKLKLPLLFLLMFGLGIQAQRPAPDQIKSPGGDLIIQPVLHGTLTLGYNDQIIYVDPYGGAEAFAGLAQPDLILITDVHGDHLDEKTLDALGVEGVPIIAPQAVKDQMSDKYKKSTTVLNNGEKENKHGFEIEAIPMYNLPEAPDEKHVKGRGNGYVLNLGGKRVYLSGDTEDIPEMRSLKDIDVAFVCMNLPYTMDVNQAASAVLEFKPKVVYPYHYRGRPDMSDTQEFKNLVDKGGQDIEVRLRNWYPEYQ